MKAVAYKTSDPMNQGSTLQDITIETPQVLDQDLLVKIFAVSVNPVDTKLRIRGVPEGNNTNVLGYDAAGVVEAVGADVKNFKPGDQVYYAGSIMRPGTNSEYHLVDERIVGNKPTSLSYAEAAALPLTTITAWEMLFDRLKVKEPTPQGGDLILVIGGGGGVGSITIQLLKALTNLKIIATASRPETKKWVKKCGAHYVIDHNQPLAPQVESLQLGAPGFVFSTTQTDHHFDDIVTLISPQGRFGLIDDPKMLNALPLKFKAISLHWELMFTRAIFNTPDIAEQGKLLNEVAALVDSSSICSTLTEVAGKINAATLQKVHDKIVSGSTQGKIVLEGFN